MRRLLLVLALALPGCAGLRVPESSDITMARSLVTSATALLPVAQQACVVMPPDTPERINCEASTEAVKATLATAREALVECPDEPDAYTCQSERVTRVRKTLPALLDAVGKLSHLAGQ